MVKCPEPPEKPTNDQYDQAKAALGSAEAAWPSVGG